LDRLVKLSRQGHGQRVEQRQLLVSVGFAGLHRPANRLGPVAQLGVGMGGEDPSQVVGPHQTAVLGRHAVHQPQRLARSDARRTRAEGIVVEGCLPDMIAKDSCSSSTTGVN
jgi:hypothetical protein